MAKGQKLKRLGGKWAAGAVLTPVTFHEGKAKHQDVRPSLLPFWTSFYRSQWNREVRERLLSPVGREETSGSCKYFRWEAEHTPCSHPQGRRVSKGETGLHEGEVCLPHVQWWVMWGAGGWALWDILARLRLSRSCSCPGHVAGGSACKNQGCHIPAATGSSGCPMGPVQGGACAWSVLSLRAGPERPLPAAELLLRLLAVPLRWPRGFPPRQVSDVEWPTRPSGSSGVSGVCLLLKWPQVAEVPLALEAQCCVALRALGFASKSKLRSERQLPHSQTLHKPMAPSLASWTKTHVQDPNSPLWQHR